MRGKEGLPAPRLTCSGLGNVSLQVASDSRPDGDHVPGASSECQASQVFSAQREAAIGSPLRAHVEYKIYFILLQENWKVCISNHCTQDMFFQT